MQTVLDQLDDVQLFTELYKSIILPETSPITFPKDNTKESEMEGNGDSWKMSTRIVRSPRNTGGDKVLSSHPKPAFIEGIPSTELQTSDVTKQCGKTSNRLHSHDSKDHRRRDWRHSFLKGVKEKIKQWLKTLQQLHSKKDKACDRFTMNPTLQDFHPSIHF